MNKKYSFELTIKSKNVNSHIEYETNSLTAIIEDLKQKIKDLETGEIVVMPDEL